MKPIDIIIFGGQSNMQGQSDCLLDTQTTENTYEYRYLSDSIVPLCNPVGEDIRRDGSAGYTYQKTTDSRTWLQEHILGSACYGNTNLVPYFCAQYTAQTGVPVLAVHAAKGSTCIEYWLPGSDGYAMLVRKASAAIQKAKTQFSIGRIFFVWLQGESDAILGNSKQYYKDALTLLCASLKTDLGIDRLGIIRVGRFVGDERDDAIIDAQCELCAEHPDFLMLTTLAEEMYRNPDDMNPHVCGHFGASGLKRLGIAAAKTLAVYKTNKS